MNKLVVAFGVLFVMTVGVSLVSAWEEQLEGCRIRGIPSELCPDDDSFVGVPYEPPVLETTSGRGDAKDNGYGTSRVWVLVGYKQVDDKVCYTSYERRIFRHRGWITYWNNWDTTMSGCVRFPVEKPINLVLDRVWYYE